MGLFGSVPIIKEKLEAMIDQSNSIAKLGKTAIQKNNEQRYDNPRLVSAYRDLLLDIAEAQALIDTVPDYADDYARIEHERIIGKLWRRLENLEYSIHYVTAELD